MRNTFVTSALFATMFLGLSGAALAGTDTSELTVSATVAASCTIDASAGLAFGTYDPVVANASANLDVDGTISTTCTNGSTATITLGQGANAGSGSTAAIPVRRMLAGTTDFLSYELYTDGPRTTVWNDTTSGSPVTGTGAPVSTTVFGRIPPGQNVRANSYSDTVLATITF